MGLVDHFFCSGQKHPKKMGRSPQVLSPSHRPFQAVFMERGCISFLNACQPPRGGDEYFWSMNSPLPSAGSWVQVSCLNTQGVNQLAILSANRKRLLLVIPRPPKLDPEGPYDWTKIFGRSFPLLSKSICQDTNQALRHCACTSPDNLQNIRNQHTKNYMTEWQNLRHLRNSCLLQLLTTLNT